MPVPVALGCSGRVVGELTILEVVVQRDACGSTIDVMSDGIGRAGQDRTRLGSRGDEPKMVTTRPLTLIGVSWSWKMNMDRKMTATSLKMPATESVTTEVR